MPRKSSSDPAEQRVIDDIAKYGWHCTTIIEEEDHPPHAFSIGLYEKYGHPEIMIVGLEGEVAHAMIGILHGHIKEGHPIDLKQPTTELLEGDYECCFIEVPRNHYGEYLGWATWYYEGYAFPVVQCIWQSRDRLYPWHPDAAAGYKALQPVLGPVPVIN